MTPSNGRKDFRVAIVGGGVCGLTCAVALARAGVHVDVYEATVRFREKGAGLGLGPNAIRILQELGVWEDVLAICGAESLNMNTFRYVSGPGDHKILYENYLPPEDRGLGIARYSFLDALLKNFDVNHAHLNKRCVNITPSPTDPLLQVITFSDGTRSDAHVVIGADGIKSSVRSIMTGKAVDSHVAWSNTAAYRGLVRLDETRAEGVKIDLAAGFWCFMGPGKHIVTYPIQEGQILNVVAFITHGPEPIGGAKLPAGELWERPTSQIELLASYDDWGEDAKALLRCLHKPSRWSICVVHPQLSSYAQGSIALLGDAAHAMLTHLGGGAGQGIEDAMVLARLLSAPGTNKHNIKNVLRVYDELRRPRAQDVWNRSVEAGHVYEALGKSGFHAEGVRKDLTGIFHSLWHYRLEDDIEEGLRRVQEMGFSNTKSG